MDTISTRLTAILMVVLMSPVVTAGTNLDAISLSEDFQSYHVGAGLNNIDPFEAASNGSVEVDPDGSGDNVGKTWIAKNDDGWSRWGWMIDQAMPRDLTNGTEVWWRVSMRFPADYDFSTSNGSLKTFRVCRVKLSDGSNRGCIDVQIKNNMEWRMVVEYNSMPWEEMPGGAVVKGKWQTFEVYTCLDSVSLDDGGCGQIKMWRDGALFSHITDVETGESGSDASRISDLKFHTYFNDGSPETQEHFFDNVAVAIESATRHDKQYLATDAHGNRFIGMATGGGTTPPIEPPDCPDCPDCPVEPPIEPPAPEDIGVVVVQDGTVVHIGDDAVTVKSDKPVNEL